MASGAHGTAGLGSGAGGGNPRESPEADRTLPRPLEEADRIQGKVAWEPELRAGPRPTIHSATTGSFLYTWLVQPLLVGKRSAILILPTLFKSVPINTTKDQNTLHFQGAKPTRWAFRQTQQGPSGEGEQANPCSSTGSLLHSNPA